MLKILFVEDDQSKVKKISSVITSINGLNIDDVDHVIDANNAKILLRENFYDLLILDIAIPNRADQEIEKEGGIQLLKEIISREIYKVPAHILGVTQYKEIFEIAKTEFRKDLLTIIHYDQTSEECLNRIRSKIGIILSSKLRSSAVVKPYASHTAIICALDDPELNGVLNNGWNWKKINLENDNSIYYQTEIDNGETVKLVHATAASKMGMTATAIAAIKMITHFRPQYLAMCGITGGIYQKINIGDIIIADPVWNWGSGKWVTKDGKLRLLSEPHQIPIYDRIRNLFKEMAKDDELLFKIRKEWQGEAPKHDINIKIGPIASGSAVLADGKIFRQIVEKQHRKIIGIEMETYALYSAAYESMLPKPTYFSGKSVVDYLGKDKNDDYQKYGSYLSAQIIKHFIEYYL